MSCSNNDLPFTGEKFSSLRMGANIRFQISRNGNLKIISGDKEGDKVLFDGLFNKDSVVVEHEGNFIIRKDYAIYYQGEWKDTLWYFKVF